MHNLELANGESLDSLIDDTENENESSDEQGFFNLDGLSLNGAKFSANGNVDNTENLSDNDSQIRAEILSRLNDDKLMAQINDAMSIVDVREKILRQENTTVGQALKLYEKLVNMKKPDPIKIKNAYEGLQEAVLNASRLRRNFNSVGTLQKVGAALQSANKGRKGSSLAETLQRAVDEGRHGTSAGRERIQVMPIPGEIARMYNNPIVKKIIEDNIRSETKNQGVLNLRNTKFSIGSSSNSGNTSNNENSSESFFTKIKNLLTGRPNQQNEHIRKKINRMLSNLTGVKIAAGHMNNGLDIVVKDVEKVIRTNRAYDWQNLLPAVGQKIAGKRD